MYIIDNVATHVNCIVGQICCSIAIVVLVMLYDDVRRREVSGGGRDIFG